MAAVYNTSGTLQSNAKVVIGSGTTNGSGNLTVTLSGSATFTSGTSYQCSATAVSNASSTTAPAIATPTSTGFTLKGAASTTYGFICIGN
jgi:hypothetical protein